MNFRSYECPVRPDEQARKDYKSAFDGGVCFERVRTNVRTNWEMSYVDRPVYDHAGRVRKQYRNIDNSTNDQLVAEYLYNKLGQVVDKKLHYSSGAYLQSVDYRYNIRGWLTSINNAQLTSDGTLNDDTGDYFGMELAYEKVISGMSNTKQSNGNISAMKWRTYGTTGAAGQRSYKYAYDFSDRLTAATFQASSAATTWDKEVNTLNETLTYDANGNIKTLVRKRNDRGLQAGTPPVITSTAQTIDDLTYIYQGINGGAQNSNVLVRVNEAVTGTTGDAGFKNGADSDTEFIYQTWGSLKKDANKGIDSIAYNFLGKPKKVYFNTGRVVEYTYDAGGNKLSVKTVNGATTESFSNYVGGFVYEGSTPALSFFGSPEGRVVKNGSNYEYQYAISDHQGNTRIIFSSVTPSTLNLTATFEGDANDNSGSFVNVNGANVLSFTAANHTASGAKVVRMNQNYAAGPSKSIKVYPGDKIDAEVWSYYEANSGYGTGSPGVAAMVTAIASGFGGVSGGGGESGSIFNGVNSALGGFGLGGNAGNTAPAAYLNYILFDQQYKVLDMGWVRVPTSAYFSKQKINLAQVAVKEAGYVFVYLSYEDQSNNYVYFDDFKVTHTKSNLIQGNEYYPFGMQTANSWTRENVTGNRFLANGGTEYNSTIGSYDLVFRNYDPALGRMNQVDPMASKYGSITPYNYSMNNPVRFNDPLGDDVEPQPQAPREYICAQCWREGQNLAMYMMVSGGGMNSMGNGWRPGQGGLGSLLSQWNPDFSGPVYVQGKGWRSNARLEFEDRRDRLFANRLQKALQDAPGISGDKAKEIVRAAQNGANVDLLGNTILTSKLIKQAKVLTNREGEALYDGEVFTGSDFWDVSDFELSELKSVGSFYSISMPTFADNSWRTPWFFLDGFLNPNMKSSFEVSPDGTANGYGAILEFGSINSRMAANRSVFRPRLANELRSVMAYNIAGKSIGVAGAFTPILFKYANGQSPDKGDYAEAILGGVIAFTGPIGLIYLATDIAVGAATGTTITDRVGAGVNYSYRH